MNYFNQGNKEVSASLTASAYFIPFSKKKFKKNDPYVLNLETKINNLIKFLYYFKNLQTSLIEIEDSFKILEDPYKKIQEKLALYRGNIYKKINHELEEFSNHQQKLYKSIEDDYKIAYRRQNIKNLYEFKYSLDVTFVKELDCFKEELNKIRSHIDIISNFVSEIQSQKNSQSFPK